MLKSTEVKEDNNNNEEGWVFTIGLYPGILFGMRTYEDYDNKDRLFRRTYVLYLPFIDFALDVYL